jgi:hypothetical protein
MRRAYFRSKPAKKLTTLIASMKGELKGDGDLGSSSLAHTRHSGVSGDAFIWWRYFVSAMRRSTVLPDTIVKLLSITCFLLCGYEQNE